MLPGGRRVSSEPFFDAAAFAFKSRAGREYSGYGGGSGRENDADGGADRRQGADYGLRKE